MEDKNHNGFSDSWERFYNHGDLLPSTFDPQADSDGDGWTNTQEAIAGTDPFSPSGPHGILIPYITYISATYTLDENGAPIVDTPAGFLIHWTGEIGKQYTLFCSPDLTPGSWFPAGLPITALNPEMQLGFTPAYTDGTLPPVLFWRIAVNDVDSDGDGFTDYEEYLMHTDPNVADSDADGLPDLWEIAYGLDPYDDGSIDPDNGPNGDKDHDGFSNIAEYLAGSNPADASSTPATVGGGAPPSTSVGAPPVLLTETVSKNGYKYGFDGFTDVDSIEGAHRRYLNRVSVVSSTETDDDGDGGSTTTTEETDPQTGHTTSATIYTGNYGQDYSTADWTVTDDTHRSRYGTDNDGSGETSTATETLSNEYTTAQLQTWTESQIPAYDDNFSEYNGNEAQIYLGPPSPFAAAYNYYLSKLKYKWEVHKLSVIGGERVNWLEVFTPDDGGSPLIEQKTWRNSLKQALSPAYEIDPSQKNSRKNGMYTVIAAEFQLASDNDIVNGWDSTREDDWVAVGVGETTSIAQLSLYGISPEAAAMLELVVDPGSATYVSLANQQIEDESTSFDINGLKATPGPDGCQILLQTKDTHATVATLHVNVFEKIEVKVAIYTVHDRRQINTNVEHRTISDPDIEDKLNAVYGPQANLHFSIDTTLSRDLDMGETTNDPVLFSTQGEFDWDTYRQNVIDKANTPTHVLPIFIVNKLLDHTKIGVTNNQQTDCFVNNDASADGTAAHEVGHYFNLSTKAKGQAHSHDLGPWPQELIDAFGTAKTGLMYEIGGITQSNWLRQEDWIEAHAKTNSKMK